MKGVGSKNELERAVVRRHRKERKTDLLEAEREEEVSSLERMLGWGRVGGR